MDFHIDNLLRSERSFSMYDIVRNLVQNNSRISTEDQTKE